MITVVCHEPVNGKERYGRNSHAISHLFAFGRADKHTIQ
ncbi:Uncharacterised protein [Vibrio cholerae]|nr:Uncharacterised protein [Vibrio cholerae]CSD96372.1 Uncharacterised protein [Vibrio cholerae]